MMLDDHAYCKDLTDPLYGYGHERIYNKCFHLTQEFSDLIVAQRAFQANSRVITVSDSLMEEIVNLKR
jgi:hypothetical protein